MEFVRKRVRGRTQRTYKEWHSECGQYRITWRSEAFGVQVLPAFHAMVKSLRANGTTYWSFAGARRPYRTKRAALEACEKNRKVWEKVLALAGERAKVSKFRSIDESAVVGVGVEGHRILSCVPEWVMVEADPSLNSILVQQIQCNTSHQDDNDPIETSENSSNGLVDIQEGMTTNTPASNATVAVESGTRMIRRARSKGTNSETESSVLDVAAAEPAPRKRVKRNTKGSSRNGKAPKQNTKHSSKPRKRRSAS